MDDPLKIFLAIASGVGLGQLILFWVTRRSKKKDTRDEQELTLESSFLAERRELLMTLRTQLIEALGKVTQLEGEKATLLREQFKLQATCNEVIAKYDFLRTLNPQANLPEIRIEPTTPDCPPVPKPEGGHDKP